MSKIARAMLGRMPVYLEYLKSLPDDAPPTISSTVIAKDLGLGEVQVRKDLGAVSASGKPRIGYQVEELMLKLSETLGHGSTIDTIIVGAGKLGKALMDYDGFEGYGVRIVAAFDIQADERITLPSGRQVLPMHMLPAYVEEHPVSIGIITVPASAAQAACDQLVKARVQAIWNFAPCRVHAPRSIVVAYEDLALSLAALAAQIREGRSSR